MVFRTLITLLFFSFIFQTASTLAQKMTIGLQAGANFSTIRRTQDTGFKVGPSAGIYLTWRLADRLRIRLEALGERKGTNQEYFLTDENGNPIGTADFAQHLDYFTVPLLLQYNFGEKSLQPFVCFGASWGFLIEETLDVSPVLRPVHRTPFFKKSDLSLCGGVGLEKRFSNNVSVQIQGRTAVGLSELDNGDSVNPVVFNTGKNLSFMLLAGVHLPLN